MPRPQRWQCRGARGGRANTWAAYAQGDVCVALAVKAVPAPLTSEVAEAQRNEGEHCLTGWAAWAVGAVSRGGVAAVECLEVVDGCRSAGQPSESFDVHVPRAAARIRTRLPERTQSPAAPIEQLRRASHPSAQVQVQKPPKNPKFDHRVTMGPPTPARTREPSSKHWVARLVKQQQIAHFERDRVRTGGSDPKRTASR